MTQVLTSTIHSTCIYVSIRPCAQHCYRHWWPASRYVSSCSFQGTGSQILCPHWLPTCLSPVVWPIHRRTRNSSLWEMEEPFTVLSPVLFIGKNQSPEEVASGQGHGLFHGMGYLWRPHKTYFRRSLFSDYRASFHSYLRVTDLKRSPWLKT